ncbi:MAG TPA: hypothetical protein PLQ93_09490 [Bacteroidia bacterium]|nr:hypothetical protein [Bacteroidia bacterium]
MLWLCKPVSSKKRFAPNRQLTRDYSFTLYEKAEQIPAAEWQALCAPGEIFLEKDYLKIVEDCSYSHLQCRYLSVYHKGRICGILYFQVIDFKAGVFGDLMVNQLDNMRSHRWKLFERYIDSNRDEILLRLFTCGNNLMSGEYGFKFSDDLSDKKRSELLLRLTDIVAREEKLRGTISATLLKDYYKPLQPASLLRSEGYSEFLIEPNMMIHIPDGIKTLDEYVALFSKKYRKRARGIFESGQAIQERELSAADLRTYQHTMYGLYENIFGNAKFKLLKLSEDYFIRVKDLFPEQFHVKGFFLGDEMLAFGSCFRMPDKSLEAHYIGFDYARNQQYNLYQNLLYALLAEAIRSGSRTVNLGRTASEIKTTVGAKAHNLYCYIKPQNTVSRLIQKPFITFLQPEPWVARNPFREESASPKVEKLKQA